MEEHGTLNDSGWVRIVLDTNTLLKAGKTVNLLDVMARVGFHLEYPDNVHVPRSVFDRLIRLRAHHRRGEEELAAIRKIKAFRKGAVQTCRRTH